MQRDSESRSGYSGIDQTENPRDYVSRLDAMRSTPFWRMVKESTFTNLGLREAERVLDVGCGTGDDVRTAASYVGAGGLVVGIDQSRTMLEEARARHADGDAPSAFVGADARSLCFADGSFDACRVERVLQHVDRPAKAVRELARVLRPGGRLVVVEPDYGTLFVGGADPRITQKILAHRRTHFASPRLGSQIPALFKACDLFEIQLTLFSSRSTTLDEAQFDTLQSKYAAPARAAGVITAEEEAAWLREISLAGSEGRFLHALTVFLTKARKPKDEHPLGDPKQPLLNAK